jgi:WASH complex subunit 7
VGKLQLDKMKVFVEQHSEELRKIESALDDTMTVGWDLDTDPISLEMTPYEQTTMLELIKTKSKPVSKVTLVFASLCQEIEVLCDTVCILGRS